MLHLYVGNGKGKTTAALGLALRACGWGKRVYFAHFLKGGSYLLGEQEVIKRYNLPIKVERFEDQVHPMFCASGDVDVNKLKVSVENALIKIERCIGKDKYDVVVLDEILNVLASKLVSQKRLVKIIGMSKHIELIFTGRDSPKSLIKTADYVSVIKKQKHPFDKKVFARKGIEY